MIATHSLPVDAFMELASGAGDSVVVRQLREAQLSKHLMLLRAVAEAADSVQPPSRSTAAFRAGYRLLEEVRSADPAAVARQLTLPQVGSWAHDCLAGLVRGTVPDFGYLAAAAAVAAISPGIGFEIDVPVTDGRVLLPGLGCLEVGGQADWITLSSDGKRLHAGEHIALECAALVPDDGATPPVPNWRGTPLVRSVADGQTWEVLLETADKHLDRYELPMLTTMTAAEVTTWRDRFQSAWELLVRQHDWAAGPIAEGVTVIVPLTPRSDLDSATSPAAFGAVATSLPPSAVRMAEAMVHEFQHIKLCGLMDMLPLVEPSADRGYAPWRDDPRPMEGMLQGVYAFTGVMRFWDVQRHREADPDAILRASVLYERWRLAIETVTGALLASGCLNPLGTRFVAELKERGRCPRSAAVPEEAAEIAREIALDNELTWQLSHRTLDASEVAALADAYRGGEPLGRRALPRAGLEDDIRKVDSIARSRLLNMRGQEPRRYRRLSASDLPGLHAADALLLGGNPGAALSAYREELAARPDPAAWIGLALAINRLPSMPLPSACARHLPLLFEIHACLAGQGIHADPLDLADWFE